MCLERTIHTVYLNVCCSLHNHPSSNIIHEYMYYNSLQEIDDIISQQVYTVSEGKILELVLLSMS